MKKFNKYITTKDFLVTQDSFDLVYTFKNGLLKTNPEPKEEDLGRYYESEDYISHTDGKSGLLSLLYQTVKKWSLQQKTRLIFKQNGGVGSLLDIGAGTGDFLKLSRERGWDIYGTEPNKSAAALGLQKGVLLENNIVQFEGQQFDVITLWHVLEHIPNLDETIVMLSKMVKPNGSLIIAVPNYKSYDAGYYKEFWAAYDVPRHLWHFSKDAIKDLFIESFNLETIKPMVFDSFYVSLLSEKYETGNKFSLNALWIGLISNLKALSSKEYSSHIYCLRKKN